MSKDNGTATIDPRSMPWPATDGARNGAVEPTAELADAPLDAVPAVADADPVVETAATETPSTEGAVATPATAPAKARRDNPLVAGLVRAMRDAVQAAREESLARFAETAKARVESIHTESAEVAAAIRRQSDQDIAGIRDWSKAEMARIREETEEQIADRRTRLEQEVEQHAGQVEHRIELVQGAVTTFEADMERFYAELLAEEDPARLAGFAEQLPEPPNFDDDVELARWAPPTTLDDDNAAAAEADFLAGLDVTSTAEAGIDLIGETSEAGEAAIGDNAVGDTAVGDATISDGAADDPVVNPTFSETEVSENLDDGSSAEANADIPTLDDQDVVDRLAKFTDPATTREEQTTSRVSVVGLISVASIASFKRALSRAAGVRSVSVASGPAGDFIFTVQHGTTTDLRTLIPELDGFAASITGDADGVITVSATEPAEAS